MFRAAAAVWPNVMPSYVCMCLCRDRCRTEPFTSSTDGVKYHLFCQPIVSLFLCTFLCVFVPHVLSLCVHVRRRPSHYTLHKATKSEQCGRHSSKRHGKQNTRTRLAERMLSQLTPRCCCCCCYMRMFELCLYGVAYSPTEG